MKNIRKIALLASIVAAISAPLLANAQYYLTANDALGTSSFNAAGTWNNAAAPSAGNTYSTEHWLLRSPATAGTYIFLGSSLTIGGTDGTSGANPFSATTPNNDSLIFKASAVTLTVTNLILDGGAVRDGNGSGQYTHLTGGLTVTTNGGAFMAQDTNYIDSNISGPGPIYIGDNGNGSAQRMIVFTSGSSTYTGSIILSPASGGGPTRSQLTFAAGSIMNFVVGVNGTNNSISGTGTLLLDGNWNIDLSGADNTVGDVWTLNGVAADTTYGSTFSINGFSQNAVNTNVWYEEANNVLYEYDETNGELSVVGGLITISQQPANAAVAPGNQANLSVSASGPGTLDYQWYFLTATSTNLIPAATNSSYTTVATSTLGATNYFVVITNGISLPVTSSVASVTVRTPRNLEWAGTGSSWDTSSLNWTLNGNVSQTAYIDADNATFDNLGASQPTVSLAQALHPTLVTVNGSTSYTLNGPGSLDGAATLTMNGSGILLLDTTNNTYSGGTLVSSGTLQVGDGTITSSLGTGPVTNNSALLIEPGTAGLVLSNTISGTGTLADSGSGSGNVYLTASNSYRGQTTINSGTLHAQNANALGASTAPLVNVNGGNLYVDLNVNILNPMTLGGNNVSLEKGGAGVSTLGGAVSLASSTTLSVDGGATLNLTNAAGLNSGSVPVDLTFAGTGAGNISGPLSLNSGSLTVNGGTWTVAPNNSYTGLTTINSGGSLFISGPLSLGPVPASFNASDVTLNGGTLGASTNVTLDDGNIGITVSDVANTSRLTVDGTNVTFIVSNNIDGDGTAVLTKTGPGTLVLAGANTFAGTLDVDSTSTSANDGTTVVANNGALANIPAVGGFPFIYIGDNNGGSSTLALNGSSGSITIAPDISLAGRNVPVQSIENIAGSNTISGNFEIAVGGTNYTFQSDSGILNLTAPLPYSTPTSARTFTFQGAGSVILSGGVQNGSLDATSTSNVWLNVVQAGPGLLTMPAANSYSGYTTVSNGVLSLTGSLNSLYGVSVLGGLLVGNGSITGPVAVEPGGTIEAGTTSSIGTLSLGNTLALSGNTTVKISKTANTADLFSGQSSVTYGGTLTVTNLAGTLALGDHFTLFSPGGSGSFSSIIGSPGGGLAYSFANGVLSVVTGPPASPTNITFHVSGNVLTLSWPANYQGWILQAQTNSLHVGISTNWVDVAGSGSETSINITINPANPTVFYRLRYPN
ncbi:MAG TPA: autotransporter-associated beta strand repeat-containing protein [Alphaproteobacteria bacterium]|nr:autotransporter-associated beta strand repeat-containing protein [Alphaproteobacteria bacterium]